MDEENKLAYNILNYERVFILLKGIINTNKSEYVYFDKSKNRYYLIGRLVILEYLNLDKKTTKKYPNYNSIAFVDERDFKKFKEELKGHKKAEFIINISYSEIDFITLDFNSLDWKK